MSINELFPPRDDLTPKVDDDDITDTNTDGDDDDIDNLPPPKQDAGQTDLTAIELMMIMKQKMILMILITMSLVPELNQLIICQLMIKMKMMRCLIL